MTSNERTHDGDLVGTAGHGGRTKHVTFRVTEDEALEITRLADAAGVSRSEYIVGVLLGGGVVEPPRSHGVCPDHPGGKVKARRVDGGYWWTCTECDRVLR